MICTPMWMRRKTRNHYVSHYHFPCKDHKWRWITWRFFLANGLDLVQVLSRPWRWFHSSID
jgi:hypothetical protein